MKTNIAFVVIVALVLCAANLFLGALNQDEGWYLLAALNTADGMAPYRDYMYTQGPVMPYVYGWLAPLWRGFGVAGGRVLSAVFGLLACGFCAGFAARVAPQKTKPFAFFIAWILTACCPVFSYFTVIPKTYALASLLVCAAFFVLAGKNRFRFEFSAILLALAAGTRIPLGALLVVVGIGLIAQCRHPGKKFLWLRFGIAGGATLLAIFLPFMIFAGEQFAFAQTYHAGRSGDGLFAWLILRAGFVSRVIQGNLMLLVVCVATFVCAMLTRGGAWKSNQSGSAASATRGLFAKFPPVFWMALAGFFVVCAGHFVAPFPYDDYVTPVIPLAAAVVAVWAATVLCGAGEKSVTPIAYALSLCAVMFLAASPLCMSWVAIRQDRLWFEFKEEPDLARLAKAGAWIRQNTGPEDVLLTQDAYLAVQSGRKVVRGLEMGPFSLFPDIDDATAHTMHLHNVATLKAAIAETDAPVAALSGYAFAVSCPSVSKLDEFVAGELKAELNKRYVIADELPDFGQGHTTLRLYMLKE